MSPQEKNELDMLQRSLLAILRREHGLRCPFIDAEGLHFVNTSFFGCADIRARILTLDPAACIYTTWGGEWPVDWVPSDPHRLWMPWIKKRRKTTFADSQPLEFS